MTSRHRSDQSPLRGPMPQYANAACGLPTPEVLSRSLPPISGYDIHAISFSRPSVGHPKSEWGPLPRPARQLFARVRTTLFKVFKRRLRRQCRVETETRRALELESAVRQRARSLYPRCCTDQKREKGMEADTDATKLIGWEKKAKQRAGTSRSTTPRAERRASNKQSGK